jgi:CubicO group peptidase (beta-lactamase class C family)
VIGACDDEQFAAALTDWGRAGFSGAVVVDGPDSSCRLGVGRTGGELGEPITADTVFAIGSVSKAVVAAAVLALEAEGALSLADPAGRHVEGLSGPAAAASIESLLLHTSGLVGSHGEDHVPLGRDEAVAAISRLTVDESSRGRFVYSNTGYTLLALVIEGASGVEYRRFLLDHVLPDGAGFWDGTPAAVGERARGIREGQPTGVDGGFSGPHWALQGNGDVAMSATLLADWTRDVFTGALLPPSAIDRMLTTAIDDDGQGVTVGWGRLGDEVLGEVALGAAGGGGDVGHEVVTLWLPDSQRVIVVATNTDRMTAEHFLQLIGPAVVAGEEIPRPDDPVDVDDEVLEAAVGSYALPSGHRFDVRRADASLTVTPTGGDALEALLPPSASPEEVADHEAAVVSMLGGETEAGADELAILEADHGPLVDVDVLGSTDEGELRTYVELTFAETSVIGWYALDDGGGIQAVDLGGMPTVRLVPTADGFRVEGRAPGDQAVTVSFDGDQMLVGTTEGAIVAERV